MIYWNFTSNAPIDDIAEKQEQLLLNKQGGDPDQYILLAEHSPCFTYQTENDLNDHRVSTTEFAEYIRRSGIPIKKFSRGGGITYHGTGQLTCYFILSPPQIGVNTPRAFTRIVDESLKELLSFYAISVYSLPELYEECTDNPFLSKYLASLHIKNLEDCLTSRASGLWYMPPSTSNLNSSRPKKIVSRGTRIKKLTKRINDYSQFIVTFGFGLNVYTDLYPFNEIIKPCGLDIEVTSIQQITGIEKFHMSEIARAFVRLFAKKINQPFLYLKE